MEISQISAKTTYQLRHKILANGQSIDEVGRPGDEEAIHFGYFDNTRAEPLAVISLYPQDSDGNPNEKIWRIRGMAVEESLQGKGLGTALMKYAEQYLDNHLDAILIWCNARKTAKGFYEKHGYNIVDEVHITYPYEGMSYRMEKSIKN